MVSFPVVCACLLASPSPDPEAVREYEQAKAGNGVPRPVSWNLRLKTLRLRSPGSTAGAGHVVRRTPIAQSATVGLERFSFGLRTP
jgi:hypothetical protein